MVKKKHPINIYINYAENDLHSQKYIIIIWISLLETMIKVGNASLSLHCSYLHIILHIDCVPVPTSQELMT